MFYNIITKYLALIIVLNNITIDLLAYVAVIDGQLYMKIYLFYNFNRKYKSICKVNRDQDKNESEIETYNNAIVILFAM